MSKRACVCFIVEGEKREPEIIENMQKLFFPQGSYEVITLPASQNIYMLWKKMKDDGFETDIIEVLRESDEEIKNKLEGLSRDDFSEVYLFFDSDNHQENLASEDGADEQDVLEQMIVSFDNETENGKLYINYPMVEALRDYTSNECRVGENCFCNFGDFANYKNASSTCMSHNNVKKYSISDWKDIIDIFSMRLSCLLGREDVLQYEDYQGCSPKMIFDKQKENMRDERVFILSAFPEFLLDYFKIQFWHACVKHTKVSTKTRCSR